MMKPWLAFAYCSFFCLAKSVPAQSALDSLQDPTDEPRIVTHAIGATIVTAWSMHGSRCDSKAQYVHLDGHSHGIERINAAERDMVESYRCASDMALVNRIVMSVSTSPRYISTAIYELRLCRGCNGGCHGGVAVRTYETRTGQILGVQDAVAGDDHTALVDSLTQRFIARYGAGQLDARYVASDLATLGLDHAGIYVERGEVWVNVNTFVLGCAEGSFFPVRLPTSMLRPRFDQ